MLVKYYKEAYELKREQRNQELWLQGLYVYEAICDVSPILNPFAKKGTKPVPYMAEPYPLTSAAVKEKEEREARLRADELKAKLSAWSARTAAMGEVGKNG